MNNIETKDSSLDFYLSDLLFPVLVGLLCAALFAGTHMYMVHNVGVFNEIFVAQMLNTGKVTGDFTAAAGFATGFLVARILEAPLVGLLDIGGALMTGVGVGLPALFLVFGWDVFVTNFWLALLAGGVIGILIGSLIIAVRKSMPEGVSASGTGILMGAGNSTGRFLGPLIIIYAVKYGTVPGIGAVVGAGIFYKMDRHIAGGAVIGAMVASAIQLYIWPLIG